MYDGFIMDSSESLLVKVTSILKSRVSLVIGVGLAIILLILIILTSSRSQPNQVASDKKLNLKEYTIPSDYSPFRASKERLGGKQSGVNIKQPVQQLSLSVSSASIENVLQHKQSNGLYSYVRHQDYICKTNPSSSVCKGTFNQPYTTNGAWAAYALLGAYDSYENPQYLADAVKEVLALRATCHGGNTECLWVLVQVVAVYDRTQNPLILAFIKEQGELLLKTTSPNSMLKSIEARELAMIYRLTLDKRYVDEAAKRARDVHEMFQDTSTYTRRSPYPYPMESCWYMLANYEIMKYLKPESQKAYSADIYTFINNAQFEKNWGSFVHPIEIQPCIELTARMAAFTKYQKAADLSSTLWTMFVNDFWDSADKNINLGEGGTRYKKGPVTTDPTTRLVVLSDTAYTVYLSSLFTEK